MPTPYGSRGGMAFSADELRVLRRALAIALHPTPLSDEDVQDCLRLAGSVVAAKHGLEGLSKVAALEGAPHGVTSNCVNPG
ncbi:hypothetical protein ABZ708_35735, partial [Streptomyces sp. NPDC006863]